MRSDFLSRAIACIKEWDDDPTTIKLFTIYYKKMLRANAYGDDISPEVVADVDYDCGFMVGTREDIEGVYGEVDPERINAEADGCILYLIDGLEV